MSERAIWNNVSSLSEASHAFQRGLRKCHCFPMCLNLSVRFIIQAEQPDFICINPYKLAKSEHARAPNLSHLCDWEINATLRQNIQHTVLSLKLLSGKFNPNILHVLICDSQISAALRRQKIIERKGLVFSLWPPGDQVLQIHNKASFRNYSRVQVGFLKEWQILL